MSDTTLKLRGEKPILFSTDMVRAILDGRKTQTRRVMKPQPTTHEADGKQMFRWENRLGSVSVQTEDLNELAVVPNECPYGKSGDVIWVRETFCKHPRYNTLGL